MARQIINVGSSPGDNTGDTLRTSFVKTNANFSEVYTQVLTDKPQNQFLAAPISGSGTPSFRSLDVSDIPANSITLAKLATALQALLVPVGTFLAYGGTTAPTNFLLCDGSAISRTTYADLFAVLGTTYGSGDGSTTFNLPNTTGRALVGKDTAGSVLGSSRNLGASFGAPTHTLTTAQIPSHSHGISPAYAANQLGGSAIFYSTGGQSLVTGSSTQSTGGGDSHNNLQPSLIVNYIVRY